MVSCIYDEKRQCNDGCRAFQASTIGHNCKIVNSGIAISGSLNRVEKILGDIVEILKK